MKVTKLTEEYLLAEQNGNYVISFGVLKHHKPATTRIRFSEINSKDFILKPTCQCTVAAKEIIDATTVEYNISYNAASLGKFDKTLVITDGKSRKELKLTGITTI